MQQLEEGLAAREKELAAKWMAVDKEKATMKATMDPLLIKRRDALDAEYLQKKKEICTQERGKYEAKIKKQEECQVGKVRTLNEKLTLATRRSSSFVSSVTPRVRRPP